MTHELDCEYITEGKGEFHIRMPTDVEESRKLFNENAIFRSAMLKKMWIWKKDTGYDINNTYGRLGYFYRHRGEVISVSKESLGMSKD